MRILFLSDTQLGAGQQFGTGESGPGSRLDDLRKVLFRVVSLARTEAVDAVVHLGDVFERSTPPPWIAIVFQEFVRELGMPLLVLPGNHDSRSAALPTILRLFDGEARVVTMPDVIPQDDCVFACLPWAPTSRLAAGGGSREEVSAAAVEALIMSAQALRVRCGEEHPGLTPILLGHWAVSGSTLPGGLEVSTVMQEPVIPWEELDSLDYKLCAFGHIHEAQVIAAGVAKTPMFYAGSTMVSNWGEAGSPHGVWIFDSVADDLKFHAVEDRRFVTVDYDNTAVLGDLRDAIVRVQYETTEDQTVDESAIRQGLLASGAQKVFVKGTVHRSSRARVEMPDEDIDPLAALELWMAANDVAAERAGLLREYHAHYLQEAK